MEEILTLKERDKLLILNNQMLKYIISHLKSDDKGDFILNIVANILGNYMT